MGGTGLYPPPVLTWTGIASWVDHTNRSTRLLMTSGGVARVLYEPGGAAFLSAADATNPFTFANSDRIAIHFKYGV